MKHAKKIFFFPATFSFILIAEAQNVGIGTTTPQARLHVRTLTSGGLFHTNATSVLESNTTNFLQFSNPSTSVSGILSGTNLSLQRSAIKFEADSSVMFTSGGTLNRMVLDNRGYLGINNFVPNSRLHVSNGASGNPTTTSFSRIATFEDNNSSYIQLLNPDINESGILAGNAQTLIKSGIVFKADSSMQLRTGGNNTRVLIDNKGYLGINNFAPISRLHVSNGVSGNPTTIFSSRIATFEDDANSYLQLLNPDSRESGIFAGNTQTLVKSGIIFTADSSILLRSGGNNTKVTIDNEGSIIFTGPAILPSLPVAPIKSNGNRFVWWSKKAALRIGGISNPVWDESSIGNYSLSAGLNTFALGDYAQGFGKDATAFGLASMAMGTGTESLGANSFSGGNNSRALGQSSFSFGDLTICNGHRSAAFGFSDTATGTNSASFGAFNNSKGINSFTAGSGLVAGPYNTIAVGSYNKLYNFSTIIPSIFAPVFVVGVGDDNLTRQNGLEVYRDASVYVQDFYVRGFVVSNLRPDVDDFLSLGSSSKRWKEVWSANPFLQSSDLRLKENILPVKYGLKTVMAMNPVAYNMKSQPGKTDLGFIAQEMEKIVPEAVVTPENDAYKAMKYTSLIPVLTQAIKEQQLLIERMQKQIETLEKLLNK